MESAVLAKITRRLIPFMFVLYIVAYLDRVNVGFAALQMNSDLGFSAAVYGFGAGIFFIGYTLFEVPSNLLLHRLGPRLWIARIMITWGIISCAMMFVTGTKSFYALRLLLGIAEAGFFPGMILYLTFWFPADVRAQAIARFTTATAMGGVIGGPISGALLELDRVGGLAGWQWLFLLEGLPAVFLGVAVLRYLPNGPQQATWLTPDERRWLLARLEADRVATAAADSPSLLPMLTSGRVWLLSVVYFSIAMGFYGISFWLPQIVKGFSGLGNFKVGLVSAIPYIAAVVAMVMIGNHSDRTGERRWHLAGSVFAAAAGFLIAASVESPLLSLASLSLAAAGIWGTLGPFWTLSTSFLSGRSAAAGIALINSVGNVGGFTGPYLVGLVRTWSQSFAGGFAALASVLLVGGCLALLIRREPTVMVGKARA